jgi:type I restriction enzyme R subunit
LAQGRLPTPSHRAKKCVFGRLRVFRDLQKALAIYGTTQTGGEMPIKDKEELVRLLNSTIQKAIVFSQQHDVELDKILKATGFEREELKDDAVAAFVEKDETRRQFLNLVGDVQMLFKSLLPDPAANQFGAIRKVLVVIAEKIRCEVGSADITSVLEQVEDVLDASIATERYVIRPSATEASYIDLSQIDFERLRLRSVHATRMPERSRKAAVRRCI